MDSNYRSKPADRDCFENGISCGYSLLHLFMRIKGETNRKKYHDFICPFFFISRFRVFLTFKNVKSLASSEITETITTGQLTAKCLFYFF